MGLRTIAVLALLLVIRVGEVGAQSPVPRPADNWVDVTLRSEDQAPKEICRITGAGTYQRGSSLTGLSCQDFYGRVVGYAGRNYTDRMGAYVCWALDPCGWPK